MSTAITNHEIDRLRDAVGRHVGTRGSLDVSGAGSVLKQPDVQREIAQLVDYLNPTRAIVPRKKGSGSAWVLNRRSAPGTTVAQFVNDTEEPDIDNGTYAQVSFTYRTILARGKVTRKLQATGRSYTDVLMDELKWRINDLRDFEDKWTIQGANATDAKQFDGIYELCPSGQKIAQGTTAGGDALTLAKLDEAIDQHRGNPSAIILSRKARRKLESLLQANQRFVNETEIAGGFRVMTYQGLPVVPSTNVPDTIWSPGSSSAPTNAMLTGGTGATSIALIVDSDNLWMGELTPVTAEPLDNKSSQYDEFDIYVDEAPVLFDTNKISCLYGFTM